LLLSLPVTESETLFSRRLSCICPISAKLRLPSIAASASLRLPACPTRMMFLLPSISIEASLLLSNWPMPVRLWEPVTKAPA
jgi:hypothetical protein